MGLGDGLSSIFVESRELLGFLADGAGFEGPGKVLHQVNTREFGALNDGHKGSINI